MDRECEYLILIFFDGMRVDISPPSSLCDYCIRYHLHTAATSVSKQYVNMAIA